MYIDYNPSPMNLFRLFLEFCIFPTNSWKSDICHFIVKFSAVLVCNFKYMNYITINMALSGAVLCDKFMVISVDGKSGP